MSGIYDHYLSELEGTFNNVVNSEVTKTAAAEETDETMLVVYGLADALEKIASAEHAPTEVGSPAAVLKKFPAPRKGKQNATVGGKEQKHPSQGTVATPGIPSRTGLKDNAHDMPHGHQETSKIAAQQVLAKFAGLSTYKVGEGPKAQGRGTALVASEEAAKNFTPREAHKATKEDLKALFATPAQSAALDPTLNNNFANTGKAGTKLAALQTLRNAFKVGE
jgi:hypothetical protein